MAWSPLQGFANTVERLDLEKNLVDRALFEEGQFAGEPSPGWNGVDVDVDDLRDRFWQVYTIDRHSAMVNCWFGLVVWIPGIPLWKGLLLGCTESQTTNPNQINH